MPIATHHPMINCQPYQPSLAARANSLARVVARILRLWRSRMRERNAFTLIDDRDLRDAGLSRYDVQRELAKPFWRG